MTEFLFLIVVISAIGVAVDAARLGVRAKCIPGGLDAGPTGYFFGVLLLWIVVLPIYLIKRPQFVALRAEYPTGKLPTVWERERAAKFSGGSTVVASAQTLDQTLEQLSTLPSSGLINDVEYAAKKAEILSRL